MKQLLELQRRHGFRLVLLGDTGQFAYGSTCRLPVGY